MGEGRRCVLVVDDDYDIRALISQILQLEGYRVFAAADGRAALTRLRGLGKSERPGLILSTSSAIALRFSAKSVVS